MHTRLGLLAVAVFGTAIPLAANVSQIEDDAPRLALILEHVGERVQRYYDNMLNIDCTEVVRQEELQADMTLKGRAKEFSYDLILVRHQPSSGRQLGSFIAMRELRTIDGKQARKTDRPKCTEPRSTYIDPLAFLLPINTRKYAFAYLGKTELRGVNALELSFNPSQASTPEAVWKGNCFQLKDIPTGGRVFIDPTTFDVLELRTALTQPFEFAGPRVVWSGPFFRLSPERKLKLARSDSTTQFRCVTFRNPDQSLLLPVSTESLMIINGAGVSRLRTTQTFSDYKRFTSQIKLRD